MAWTDRTWVANVTHGTAAIMNEIRDNFRAIGDAWTPYTPTLTGSSSDPTMGTSSIAGSWRLAGKTADVKIGVTIGVGFVAGSGFYRLDLPSGMVPISSGAGDPIGTCTVWDTSAQVAYNGVAIVSTGTTLRMFIGNAAVGSAGPVTFATGDRISVRLPSMEIT